MYGGGWRNYFLLFEFYCTEVPSLVAGPFQKPTGLHARRTKKKFLKNLYKWALAQNPVLDEIDYRERKTL